jgi:hypothetical protein
MTAWLITKGNGAYPQTEIVDILSARRSVEAVQQYVERLHNSIAYTLWERCELAAYNKPRRSAYRAQVHPFADRSRGIEIHCGHDPYFIARPVRNLVVETDTEAEFETVTWESVGTGKEHSIRMRKPF